MTMFTGFLKTRKIRNKQQFKCELHVFRRALNDAVRYHFRADSIQHASRHALYLMLNEVSDIDGLNIHAELYAALARTYSDVRNCLHGYAVAVTREEYHGDVIDRHYIIDNLIATSDECAALTVAQCAQYCGEVSEHNRRYPSSQRTFTYSIRGGKVAECYAQGQRVTTLAEAKRIHGV